MLEVPVTPAPGIPAIILWRICEPNDPLKVTFQVAGA